MLTHKETEVLKFILSIDAPPNKNIKKLIEKLSPKLSRKLPIELQNQLLLFFESEDIPLSQKFEPKILFVGKPIIPELKFETRIQLTFPVHKHISLEMLFYLSKTSTITKLNEMESPCIKVKAPDIDASGKTHYVTAFSFRTDDVIFDEEYQKWKEDIRTDLLSEIIQIFSDLDKQYFKNYSQALSEVICVLDL